MCDRSGCDQLSASAKTWRVRCRKSCDYSTGSQIPRDFARDRLAKGNANDALHCSYSSGVIRFALPSYQLQHGHIRNCRMLMSNGSPFPSTRPLHNPQSPAAQPRVRRRLWSSAKHGAECTFLVANMLTRSSAFTLPPKINSSDLPISPRSAGLEKPRPNESAL
jgi:hypothetical protein